MAQSCRVGDTVKFYAAQAVGGRRCFRAKLQGIHMPDTLDILTGKLTATGTDADGAVLTISSGGLDFQATPYQIIEVVQACA